MMRASAKLAEIKNSKSKRRRSGRASTQISDEHISTKKLKEMNMDEYEMYMSRHGF